jgi:hypothetical protein
MDCTLHRIYERIDWSGVAEFEARRPEQEKEKLKEALRERRDGGADGGDGV